MTKRDLILELLPVVGFEVGDYHHDEIPVIDRSGKLFYVKLEGWGPECVPGKGKRVARAESEKLAQEWRRGWQETGSIDVIKDRDVWAITWAVSGPFERELGEDESEYAIDLRGE